MRYTPAPSFVVHTIGRVAVEPFDRQVEGGSAQENGTLFVTAQMIRRSGDAQSPQIEGAARREAGGDAFQAGVRPE